MNGPEMGVNLLVAGIVIWLSAGLVSSFLAHAWARRPFSLKDSGSYVLLGPVVLLAVLVLSAGYVILSPLAGRRSYCSESSAGMDVPELDSSGINVGTKIERDQVLGRQSNRAA